MAAGLSVLVMLIVAYSFWREGVFTAFCMLINVVVAGFVAFNFFEPLADLMEPLFAGFMPGYEDCVALILLAAGVLGLLRWATNQLVNTQIDYHPMFHQFGAGFVGLVTGYLLAGFLLCVFQTLPWHENFLNLEVKVDSAAPNANWREILPPDRVWLALMHRAGEIPFSQSEGKTFDPYGNFELRYARYRRYNDVREAMPYHENELPVK
jgi:Colicin V production protein